MIEIIAQIILAAFITERLLEGLHKFYWTKKLKEQLVGIEPWSDGAGQSFAEKSGILSSGPLREFVRCKFCQSWWGAWGVCLVITLLWQGWSLHWIWMGFVAGSLSNIIHDVRDRIKCQ